MLTFIMSATDAIYHSMWAFMSYPKRLPRTEIRRKYSPSHRFFLHPICVKHKLGLPRQRNAAVTINIVS